MRGERRGPMARYFWRAPPERIRDSLIERANRHGAASYVSEEVEAELLARQDRLLDLTLAEFCQHAETARALFFREL
jgi:hypothetical protein